MRWLCLLLLCARAWADATPPPSASGDGGPTRCDYMAAPYWRAMEWTRKLPQSDGYVAATAHHALLSDREAGTRERTRVYAIGTPKPLVDVAVGATAPVEDVNGRLVGLLAITSRWRRPVTVARFDFFELGGKRVWHASLPDDLDGESGAAILDGERLYVTVFHRISSGSQLFAFDARTGAVVWRGDVVQLNVPHSKYFNDVELRMAGGRVTMIGTEAGGCYVQTFDAPTGRRLSSRIFGR
jgi:PQQ-like domain